MPKLNKKKRDSNKAEIEQAALSCFLKYGYHGVTVRQIAKAAKVSLGNLYIYFPDKLSLFDTVFESLRHGFMQEDNPMLKYLLNCDFPNDLGELASAIESSVERYGPYFKLTYIDVVEFEGKRASLAFSNVYDKLSLPLKSHFSRLGGMGPHRKMDPGFAFVAIYLQFYYFFALRGVFKAKNIFGDLSDRQVVNRLIDLYQNGMQSSNA